MASITGGSILNAVIMGLMILSLPVVIICVGLLFARGANWIHRKPKAALIAGISLGVSNVGILLDRWVSSDGPPKTMWLVFYGLMVVTWPIWGLMEYKRRKAQIERQPQ